MAFLQVSPGLVFTGRRHSRSATSFSFPWVGRRPMRTPSKILSYMGIPCSAVASFMGVIAQVRDLFMSLIHTCELSDANPFDYLIQLQNHASELAESPRD
jgi:hypothetical protein